MVTSAFGYVVWNPRNMGARGWKPSVRGHGEHPVTSKEGTHFDGNAFRGRRWAPAFLCAGIPYRRPYATRHTFAAWSLMVGIHADLLVGLVGHSSRQVVYQVYGRYVAVYARFVYPLLTAEHLNGDATWP